jgi:hypothetical protein
MNKFNRIVCGLILAIMAVALGACDFPSDRTKEPTSASGVSKAEVKVPTDVNGNTTEQLNVRQRLLEDNRPGAVKHLYIISAYSGQVILYSTVKGKVTSSGKRLNPINVTGYTDPALGSYYRPFQVQIGNEWRMTNEVLQDDGTYGSSVEYIYWFDVRGTYHQHYVTGGQIVHVASQPLSVKNIIINVESVNTDKEDENSSEDVKPKKK